MPIDFTLSKEQLALRDQAREFADTVLSGVGERLDLIDDPAQAYYAQRDIYAEFAKAGFAKALIPVENGGTGFTLLDFGIATEELARVDVNVPTTLLAAGLALQPIIQFGTAEQRRRFLEPFVDDTDGSLLAAWAFTDTGGGANFDSEDPAGGIQTTARPVDGKLIVNGEKHYIVNGTGWDGNGAHLYSVVCRTDLSKPASEALTVVVVPGDTPGIEVVECYNKIGHRGTVTAKVAFHDCEVGAENMIGRPGQGKQLVSRAFSWTAAIVGAASVGVMRAGFDFAYEFCTTERRLGTVPVIEHQAVGYMLAECRMRIEAARYLAWKACHYADVTDNFGEELCIMAKVYCGELAVQTIYDLMRVVGTQSYTNQTPLERLMRDALAFPLYDQGNMGIRRRQLHEIMLQPGYDQMLAAESRVLDTPYTGG